MNGSGTGGSGQRSRVRNAVPLQNAVLCAECDVVSDSPHATCLVCGSPSLFNIARMFGGKLPKGRASLIAQEGVGVSSCDVVLRFPSLTGSAGGQEPGPGNSRASNGRRMKLMKLSG